MQHAFKIGQKLGDYLQRRRNRVIDVLVRAKLDGRTEASLQAEFVWPGDSMHAMLIDLLNRGDIVVHAEDIDLEAPRYVAVAYAGES
jgi:hypothetical protein